MQLETSISLRIDFGGYSGTDVERSAKLLVKSGLGNMAEIRLSRRKTPRIFRIGYACNRIPFRGYGGCYRSFRIIPTSPQKPGHRPKMPRGEIDIPTRLKKYDIDIAEISDPIPTVQATMDIILQDLATDSNRNPVSKPYIRIYYRKAPIAPSIVAHGNSHATSKNKMKQYKSPQSLATMRYTVYRMRVVMARRYVMHSVDSGIPLPSSTTYRLYVKYR